MKQLKKRVSSLIPVFLLTLSAWGCGTDSAWEGDSATAADEWVWCGAQLGEDGVGLGEGNYNFAAMNRELQADPELQRLSGINAIDDCVDAGAFRMAQDRSIDEKDVVNDDAEKALVVAADVAVSGEDSQEPIRKIWQGVSSNHPDLAGVQTSAGNCSGVFLNSRTVLTAAHCLPSGTSDGGSDTNCRVRDDAGYSTGGTITCTGYRHADYDGTGDGYDDVGILVLPASHANTGAGMYLYVGSVGLGETFEVHGWGPTGSADWGDLREDPDGDPLEVSARYDLQLRTQAYQGRARLCNGDSGTPMLKLVTGRKSAVTVFSNHYVDTPESLCTCYKCREEHTRLGPKLAWISARVENPGHDGCKVSSHHADLRWCW